MSRTADLDKTIELLNTMLEQAQTLKEKLSVTDRLARFYGLKYKHSDEGRGGKFAPQTETSGHTDGN
jgi:hypothetical protein